MMLYSKWPLVSSVYLKNAYYEYSKSQFQESHLRAAQRAAFFALYGGISQFWLWLRRRARDSDMASYQPPRSFGKKAAVTNTWAYSHS